MWSFFCKKGRVIVYTYLKGVLVKKGCSCCGMAALAGCLYLMVSKLMVCLLYQIIKHALQRGLY